MRKCGLDVSWCLSVHPSRLSLHADTQSQGKHLQQECKIHGGVKNCGFLTEIPVYL